MNLSKTLLRKVDAFPGPFTVMPSVCVCVCVYVCVCVCVCVLIVWVQVASIASRHSGLTPPRPHRSDPPNVCDTNLRLIVKVARQWWLQDSQDRRAILKKRRRTPYYLAIYPKKCIKIFKKWTDGGRGEWLIPCTP